MNKSKVFKEIIIGGLKKEELIAKLVSNGIQFNKYAEMLFAHPGFKVSEKTEKISLVKVNLQELRINTSCTFDEIINAATKFEYKLCPLSLGVQLRLEYLEQPEGPYLHIASKKPEEGETYPNGFYLRNFENSLWLRISSK